MLRMLIAGNWKMNGLQSSLSEVRAIVAATPAPKAEILICPPATLISAVSGVVTEQSQGTPVAVGGQDCHADLSGAHTGDLSAEMLKDAGATYVIVGHSERRANHGETDAMVRAKAEAAWRAGLTAIVCVGETQAERDAEQALDTVERQMTGSIPDGATAENLVVAYEPVWAIGSGRTPTLPDIGEMHDAMRALLSARFGPEAGAGIRLLYGGSVKPDNASEIFTVPNVNGALVGGASLKAADFLKIAAASA